MSKQHMRAWDDYFIPGTLTLRNKKTSAAHPHGDPDPDRLRAFEEYATSVRIRQLANAPIVEDLDYDHLKAIHRHLFQDVYEWAGEERTAPHTWMSKDGHNYYPAGPALTEAAQTEFARIKSANYLRNLDKPAFVTELAERWGELNVVHPFREGNTRTQFVFFTQLVDQAGYQLDTRLFMPGAPTRDAFINARFHSQDTGSNDRLVDVLNDVTSLRPTGESTTAWEWARQWHASFGVTGSTFSAQPQPKPDIGQ